MTLAARAGTSFGLGQLLSDHAVCVLRDGLNGEQALVEATRRALNAYAAKAARQIEEHYCRKASSQLTRDVRDRIASAIGFADVIQLARECSGLDRAVVSLRPAKRVEIDDGVPL